MEKKQQTTKKGIHTNKTFQEELKGTLSTLKQFKLSCEANIVAIFWKNPSLLYEFDNITLKDFDENEWRVYWQVATDIIIGENKSTLDEYTVGQYLMKHPKLSEKFTEYGGMETIQKSTEYIKEANMTGYIRELHKWNSVIKLAEKGFPVNDRLSDFANMYIEDIYDEYEIHLNNIFANADMDIKSYDISDGIYDLIDELDKGDAIGLPLSYLPMLNSELGGLHIGDITLIGGVSNAGKSTFLRIAFLSSIFEDPHARTVIFLNEEGLKKWQREMLVWIANTQFKKDLQKYQIRDGQYNTEMKALLVQCAGWLEKHKANKKITIVPLEKYATSMVVKLIKKYSTIGIQYFAIDTFKMDNMDGSTVNDNTRLQMVQNMTTLYNTVKESCKNVCLICTVQLTKGSSKMRYLTLDAIGESKNIVDPCSTALFIRNIFEDEYPTKSKALKVYKYGQQSERTKVEVTLDPNKRYQIIFVSKSRESSAGMGSHQFVVEVDYSKNIMKEVGFTTVTPDF